MHIGLIALDERPVNTRYPAMIAQIAGVTVMQPPPELRSQFRTTADCEGIGRWLREHAPNLDALIVSVETLGYGGLILSRITEESAVAVLNRLEVLREIKHLYPVLTVYGFNLITRISYSDDSIEEPLYWATYGSRLYRFSQLFDRAIQGQVVEEELTALRAELPPEYTTDFVKRRMRNHAVNLAVLQMLVDGVFDLLVISSDDTSEYGFGSREKRWLTEWMARIGGDFPLLMYPGADEVGCALLARVLNNKASFTPRFAVHYAIEADRERIAPFEDGAVSLTVERQIRAVGGIITPDDDADFILAVNPPSPSGVQFFHYTSAFIEAERQYRHQPLKGFVERISEWIGAGKRVIVADVAYPNGSDPVLFDLLREQVDLTQLAAYGGWNTAGNTIGVALAQGIASARATNETARLRFLLHRYLEDWGYQHGVRQRLQEWLGTMYGTRSIDDMNIAAACAFIETELGGGLNELPGFAGKWRIAPGSTHLPWKRTFEVDFDLEPITG